MDEDCVLPDTCRLSLEHSSLVTAWGRTSYNLERETNELREIFATNYAVNIREFMLLGPEIRYYLQMALDEESKIILTKSLDSRNKSVLLRRRRYLVSVEMFWQKYADHFIA
jgi:hypothetical protein